MIAERIDLRGTPLEERGPAIFAAFDAMETGESITIVTEYDPRSYAGRLEQIWPGEVLCSYRRVSDSEWSVTLARTEPRAQDLSPAGVLKRAAAFAPLGAETRAALTAAASARSAHKDDVIIRENESLDYVGVLGEGVLALVLGKDVRQRVLCEIFSGEVFGEVAFFDRGMTLGRYIVLSKTARYVILPHAELRVLAQRDPLLLSALGGACAQRARGLSSALTSQVSQPIIVRVARALLPYAIVDAGLCPVLPPLGNMTQSHIAAAAGTVKEVAARAIAEIENRGALRRERGHICYLDRCRLVQIIEEA